MADNFTPDYVLVDLEDPERPRLVIARGIRALPVEIDDEIDGPGQEWLKALDWDRLDWIRDVLEDDVGVQIPRPGYAARLRRWRDVPAAVPAGTNGSKSNGSKSNGRRSADDETEADEWFDGWTDSRLVEHHTGVLTDDPDLEPFEGWVSWADYEDELTVRTWNYA